MSTSCLSVRTLFDVWYFTCAVRSSSNTVAYSSIVTKIQQYLSKRNESSFLTSLLQMCQAISRYA